MKKIYLLSIVWLHVLLASCVDITNNENLEKIIINPNDAEEVKLSEFIDSIIYIKLQSDSNCYTGIVSDILIKKKYIYLNDMSRNAISVFDKKGRLVSSLNKKGKGRGEYIMISGFFVDSLEKTVQVLDGIKNQIITYSNIKFEYIQKKEIFHIVANTVRKHYNYLYYSTHRIDNLLDTSSTNTTNADIIICKDNHVIKTIFPKKIITNHSYFSVYPESFTLNDNNNLFASIMFDNTFYQLDGLNAIPILKIDFQKYGIDNEYISLSSTEEQMKYISSIENKGKAMLPFLTVNNNDLLSFSYCVNIGNRADEDYNFPFEFRTYLYFKNSKKSFHAKRFINDITDFPKDIWLTNFNKSATVYESWYQNYLVYIISPSVELNVDDKIITNCIGEVHINDNPIIMLLKLKNF
ncbi:MAG: 6-bladed beta-propeller [Bacteroidales bacterium]|nr:6-bladed beta-propeller [Bacteroidales bacterium]